MKVNWYKLIAYTVIVFVGCSFWYLVISKFVKVFS